MGKEENRGGGELGRRRGRRRGCGAGAPRHASSRGARAGSGFLRLMNARGVTKGREGVRGAGAVDFCAACDGVEFGGHQT